LVEDRFPKYHKHEKRTWISFYWSQ